MYVSNDILNSKNVMGLLILVLDTYVFSLVLDAVIFSVPHFISVVGDIPISIFFFRVIFFHAKTSFFSEIGDIPLGAPRPNALMKGI